MTRLAPWLLVLSMMLGVLTGCEPAVALRTANLRGATPTGIALDAVLSVENPNVFDVQIRAVRANAQIDKVRGFIPVYVEPNAWIPAGRRGLITVPIIIPWTMLPAILAATISDSTVTYMVKGSADVTATRAFAIDRDMYKFDEEGEIPRGFFVRMGQGGISFGMGR